MKKLTEEQQKLVAENHNLIYSFLHHYHFEIEEFYDIAAIGLCRAAANFDASRGNAFSTYAYKAMYSQILLFKRQEKNKKAIPPHQIISYDSEVSNEEGDTSFFVNSIASKENLEKEVVFTVFFEDYVQSLKNEKDKKILELLEKGYSQKEIAEIFGCSRSRISMIKTKIKRHWEKILEDTDKEKYTK